MSVSVLGVDLKLLLYFQTLFFRTHIADALSLYFDISLAVLCLVTLIVIWNMMAQEFSSTLGLDLGTGQMN